MRLEPLYRIRFTYPEGWAVGLEGGWQQMFFIAEGRPPGRRQIVGAVFHFADGEPYRRLNDVVCVSVGEVRAVRSRSTRTRSRRGYRRIDMGADR
jgi:hypothetical protein